MDNLRNMEAVILAGGFGTRLQSVISDIPKPMAPVFNRPFIEYLLDYLIRNGVSHVVLSVGYKHDIIISHLGNRYKSLKIDYAIETQPLGTGGGIQLALEKCTSEFPFILNGDTFFNVSLMELMQFSRKSKCDVALSLKKMINFDRYGIVTTNEFRVTGFRDRQFTQDGEINGGVYVIKREIFTRLKMPEKFSFETDFLEKYCSTLCFCAYRSDQYFIDIGIPSDFEKANRDFEKFDLL